MEKLGEESAAKFINALIKSVQTLCHGYLDFQNGVEIIGHINLSVDKGSSLDYILKEKVCRNAENSTLFISNSFHAEPKPEQDVSGNTSQSGNQVTQNSESADDAESGKVSSAISSISTALTESRERTRRNSGAKDSSSSYSQSNTSKRKASEDDSSEFRPAKISYHDKFSNVTSESSNLTGLSSPVDSKEALQALRTADTDLSEMVLPQTASVRSDGSDIGVNLAGSVLEPVEGQNNPDLPEREDDSDGDLEVTFIKEEYVEGEGSACDFDGQQFARGPHQRASDGMPDPSLFSLGPQSSSASATYVPSAAGQQFPANTSSSSTSQPQPGPSGMRGPAWEEQGHSFHHVNTDTVDSSSSSLLFQQLPQAHFTSSPAHEMEEGNWNLAAKIWDKRRENASLKAGQSGKIFLCDFCDATFASVSGWKGHMNRVHLNKLPYSCNLCGKGFTKLDNYEGHMNMHNNIKAYKCPYCSKKYPYRTSLNMHLRTSRCKMKRNITGGPVQ